MRRSTILFSCARFIMLSLKGTRHISGNSVTMSIFIDDGASFQLAIQAKSKLEAYSTLFHDLKGGTLAVAPRRAVQQRANGMDRLAVAPDHAADIALTQLHFEDGRSST